MARRVVALVAVAALAAAQASEAATPNPCTLLTNAEVAQAIGSKVESRQVVTSEGGKGSKTCRWTGVDLARPSSYPIHHSLTLTTALLSRRQFLKLANESQGAVRVNGIGRLAYHQGNGAIMLLEVWQKGVWLTFVAGYVTNPLASEEIAARAALARL